MEGQEKREQWDKHNGTQLKDGAGLTQVTSVARIIKKKVV